MPYMGRGNLLNSCLLEIIRTGELSMSNVEQVLMN